MKQITFKQKNSQLGDVKGILRIDKKLLYFKFNNTPQAQQMMVQMQKKGAIITPGGERKWIRVNMFGNLDNVNLGKGEFNPKEKSDEEIEKMLFDFYLENYTKANFECEVADI